jgi:hypothetical protein
MLFFANLICIVIEVNVEKYFWNKKKSWLLKMCFKQRSCRGVPLAVKTKPSERQTEAKTKQKKQTK